MARKSARGGLHPGTWLLVALVLALGVSWAWQFGHRTTHSRLAGRHVVRVQVLNGSGEPGVATRIAAFLRDGGFQVTEVRNADRGDYFASFVVARRTDLSLAREVAHYLGDPPLVQQVWSSDLADVTLLIGSDRSRLQLQP